MGKQVTQRSRSGVGPAGQRSNDLGRWVAASLGQSRGLEFFFSRLLEQNQESVKTVTRGIRSLTARKTNNGGYTKVRGFTFLSFQLPNTHIREKNNTFDAKLIASNNVYAMHTRC